MNPRHLAACVPPWRILIPTSPKGAMIAHKVFPATGLAAWSSDWSCDSHHRHSHRPVLPRCAAAREASACSQCQNNLKQIGLAVQAHHDVKKQFPMGRNRADRLAGFLGLLPAARMEEGNIRSIRARPPSTIRPMPSP